MYPSMDSIACFVAAAKTLNFRQAAVAVSLTPAALGKRIQQLEEGLGGRLFERTTRHVALTPSGVAMLPHARRLLEVGRDCVRAGRGQAGPAPTKLRLGTRFELGLSWIMPMLPHLQEALPHVDIDLYFGSGLDLEERVKGFDVHCAVTSRVFVDPVFDSVRLQREDYVFVGAPQRLAAVPFRVPEDAAHHTLIDVQRELPLLRYFRDAEDAPAKLSFAGVRTMGTIEAIRRLVILGAGVAVLPLYLVEGDLRLGRLERIYPNVELLFDYFRLVYRRDDPHTDVYKVLCEVMQAQSLT